MSWDVLTAALATARAEIAAIAPDAATLAEADAYMMRCVASALSDAFLSQHLTHGGLTRPIPTKGGPNPDFLMCHAAIDPARRYRLAGEFNDSERIGVGLYSIAANGAMVLAGYRAFTRTNMDASGRFELTLAPDASGTDALAIAPQARVLLVRTLHRAPHGRAANLVLTGGTRAPILMPATGTPDGALAQAARGLLTGVRQFIVWSQLTSAAPNRFSVPPADIAESVRGDPDITYYLGYYDLGDDEWLEVTRPARIGVYWSLHAYTHWLESLGTGAHDRNAEPDGDGAIRMRIGPDVPAGMTNRLDTLGRRRGVLIFRSIGAADVPIPAAEVRR